MRIAVARHRAGDAPTAHRALAKPSEAGRRHPRVLALLRAIALFHLPLAARHLGRRGDAANLMRRAAGLDPELPGLDGLRRARFKGVLADVPGTADPASA